MFLGIFRDYNDQQWKQKCVRWFKAATFFRHKLSRAIFQISQRHHQVGLFVQQGVGVKPIYSRAVKEFYRSEIKTVDFGASGSGNVVKAVNEWVEGATKGKLLKILDKVWTRWGKRNAFKISNFWQGAGEPDQADRGRRSWDVSKVSNLVLVSVLKLVLVLPLVLVLVLISMSVLVLVRTY